MNSIDWLIEKLENQIKLSAYNQLGTERTGEYRIGLRKAIDFCHEAKEMHKRETIKFGYDFFASIEENEECIITKLPEELYQETFQQPKKD